ncbi:universal stress protein UspA [Streptomyces solincola]|uniref:Universal stress protein UspA n=1 Tax=Streptomyces solincola TaxID=2100817 RepID=A0A2S9PT57_9ACTN|nr:MULTISPECIES: universal stress protein [Streptomyces]PRH77584.1 universal stress protein UspA [Streptomyces solincola]
MAANRIVVGVDGSEPSLKALAWAAGQARLTGAVLEAVACWEYPPNAWAGIATGMGPTAPALPDDYDPESLARKELDEALAAALDGPTAAAAVRRVVPGHAAQALTEIAEGADLLVVGDRGYSGVRAALLGSVSTHVAQHAPCPVVVVRGEGPGAPSAG